MTPYPDINFFSRLYLRLPESDPALRMVEQAQVEAEQPEIIDFLRAR